MRQYLELLRHVLEQGTDKDDRTGCSVGERRDHHNQASPTRISGRLSTWPIVSQPNAR